MLQKIINWILRREKKAERAVRDWIDSIESEATEEFLKLLLNAMKFFFIIKSDYRKNIKEFSGRYLFRSRDGKITVSAIFKNGKMDVLERVIEDPDVTVNFRDAKALRNYILSPKPDILGSLLRQDVVPDGNLNYLYKFAFMAKRLQLMATGKI